jgi:hypothetical protein
METSLSCENDSSQVVTNRTSSSSLSTQEAHQFGNHMVPKQSVKDPGKNGGVSSIIDKNMDSIAEKVHESNVVDDMTVGETEVITNNEADMAANST